MLNEKNKYKYYKNEIEFSEIINKKKIEYINQKTMYKIVLNSENIITSKFKKEVSKLLCQQFTFNLYDFSSKELLIEEETNTILNDYFENIEERYENELLLKLKPTIDITKILTIQQNEYAIDLNKRYYDYLELKEKHRHIEVMKDKDIELKNLELQILKYKHT